MKLHAFCINVHVFSMKLDAFYTNVHAFYMKLDAFYTNVHTFYMNRHAFLMNDDGFRRKEQEKGTISVIGLIYNVNFKSSYLFLFLKSKEYN